MFCSFINLQTQYDWIFLKVALETLCENFFSNILSSICFIFLSMLFNETPELFYIYIIL